MDPRQRHARLKELFGVAEMLDDHARVGFLERECDDEELRRDVERLLSMARRLDTDDGASAEVAWESPVLHDHLPTGVVVGGKFRIDGVLGEGGSSVVYEATQLSLARAVALKVLRQTASGVPEVARRFERESLVLARLRHPNIVTIHDFGIDLDVGAYLAMERLEGETLRSAIARRGAFDLAETVRLFAQVCAATQAAHDAGVVHRDLKPENIILSPRVNEISAMVVDFGVAKLQRDVSEADPNATASGLVIGTPRYMSPEQAMGARADARADVYALGCILFEMLAGRPVFESDSGPLTLYRHLHELPPDLASVVPGIPASLGAAVARALAKQPEERTASAADLCDALANALDDSRGEPVLDVGAGPTGDVFVVDDEPENLALLAKMLRGRGYRVRLAHTAARALAAIRAAPPDLILLDVRLPDLDGYQVCQRLKADPLTSDVPVIFLSALDEPVDKVRGFEVGGLDYIAKPFDTVEVMARVETQTRQNQIRRGLESSRRALERHNADLSARNAELIASERRVGRGNGPSAEAAPGALLDGRYRLGSVLGVGGFGVVYRAEHVSLRRQVAVKVLRHVDTYGREDLERFAREGVSACHVRHPNAVAVLDAGLTRAGTAYLVMELLEGRTLADEIRMRAPLPLRRCAEILVAVAGALGAAHEAGVVHRDVKPANIFLDATGGAERVKVLDFGLAAVADSGTAAGRFGPPAGERIFGTPRYIAPELLAARAHDARVDTYSVGVVVYEMLCGRTPFETASVLELLARIAVEAPAPLSTFRPDLPSGVERAVLAALAKEPENRPFVGEFARSFVDACPDERDLTTATVANGSES